MIYMQFSNPFANDKTYNSVFVKMFNKMIFRMWPKMEYNGQHQSKIALLNLLFNLSSFLRSLHFVQIEAKVSF